MFSNKKQSRPPVKYKMSGVKCGKGFTIIEIIIVMGISMILLTIIISFTSSSDKYVTLFSDQSKLVAAITRAKSLSIQTFISDIATEKVCGYGVYFPGISTKDFIFFKDAPEFPATECIENNVYTGNKRFDPAEATGEDSLSESIKFQSLPLDSVLFIPPEPKTVIMPGSPPEALIVLSTEDDSAQAAVKVTSVGQITTQ